MRKELITHSNLKAKTHSPSEPRKLGGHVLTANDFECLDLSSACEKQLNDLVGTRLTPDRLEFPSYFPTKTQ